MSEFQRVWHLVIFRAEQLKKTPCTSWQGGLASKDIETSLSSRSSPQRRFRNSSQKYFFRNPTILLYLILLHEDTLHEHWTRWELKMDRDKNKSLKPTFLLKHLLNWMFWLNASFCPNNSKLMFPYWEIFMAPEQFDC